MYKNGSVSNNIRYQDICNSDIYVVNIAYVDLGYRVFEVVNNTMIEYYEYDGLINVVSAIQSMNEKSYISYEYEILKTFFQNNNILIINWQDCNGTQGLFNHDTGKWTGITGQVNNNNEYKFMGKNKTLFLD